MIAREIGLRRVLLAGAILGAAVGGMAATVINGMSGPTFWAGIAAGLVVGPVCLLAVSGVFDLVQTLRRISRRA